MCGVGFDKLYEEIETKEEEKKKNFCSFSNEKKKKKAFIYFSVFKMDFLEPWEVFYFSFFDCFQPIV